MDSAWEGFAAELAAFAGALSSCETVEDLERRYQSGARRFFPGRDLGFYLLDPVTRAVRFVGATGVSDFFLARYEEAGRPVDPVLQRTFELNGPATLGSVMSREAWLRHPMYTEVCHLHGLTRLIEAPVVVAGGIVGTLYVAGDDATPEPSRAEVAVAGSVGQLVGLALSAIEERHAVTRERDQAVAALELCDAPVAISDLRTGRRRLNAAACALLAGLAGAGDASVLDELMADQRRLEGGGFTAQATVALVDGAPATLSMRSVRPPEDPSTIVSFLRLEIAGLATLPRGVEAPLTPRERDVARLVVAGLRDVEIAQRLVISPHTVNQHLKRVYAKLGVDGRVGLTRLAFAPPLPDSRE